MTSQSALYVQCTLLVHWSGHCANAVYTLCAHLNSVCVCYAVRGHTGASCHVCWIPPVHDVHHRKNMKKGLAGAQVRCSTCAARAICPHGVCRKWPVLENLPRTTGYSTLWTNTCVRVANIGHVLQTRHWIDKLQPHAAVYCAHALYAFWALERQWYKDCKTCLIQNPWVHITRSEWQ